ADQRDRRPRGVADLGDDGRVRLVRAAEVDVRELDEVLPELVELRPVEPELVTEGVALGIRQVAAAEERGNRVRLDDPEQEEVEDDDEDERPERAQDLAADVSGAQRRARARSGAATWRSRRSRTSRPSAPRSISAPSARPPVSGPNPEVCFLI